jgi:hypothetical protein
VRQCINDSRHNRFLLGVLYAECCYYAACLILLIVMLVILLSVAMLSFRMLSVVMLTVVMLSIVMLSVVGPFLLHLARLFIITFLLDWLFVPESDTASCPESML